MENLNQIQQLFQLGQQMQARLADVQRRLERETFTVSTGGGLVEVTADGKGTIRGIRIDPAAVDPSEVEMLEDLVLAAVTQAQNRAREQLEREMKQAAGGVSLPGLGGILGG